MTPLDKFNKLVDKVRNYILGTKNLDERCRFLALNFEEVFLRLSQMSPPVNYSGSKLPFDCLHKYLSVTKTKNNYENIN